MFNNNLLHAFSDITHNNLPYSMDSTKKTHFTIFRFMQVLSGMFLVGHTSREAHSMRKFCARQMIIILIRTELLLSVGIKNV
jgi:hypothetical protein